MYYSNLPKQYNKSCVILFTMNGCPYCDIFKPEWEKFKRKMQSKIDIVEVNRSQITKFLKTNGDFINDFLIHVQGFPTILLKKHKKIQKYSGTRKCNDLIKFSKSLL